MIVAARLPAYGRQGHPEGSREREGGRGEVCKGAREEWACKDLQSCSGCYIHQVHVKGEGNEGGGGGGGGGGVITIIAGSVKATATTVVTTPAVT